MAMKNSITKWCIKERYNDDKNNYKRTIYMKEKIMIKTTLKDDDIHKETMIIETILQTRWYEQEK